MKILGREPALVLGVIVAGISLLGTLGFAFLSDTQAELWIAVVNGIAAGLLAWTTRPFSPGVYTYIVGAFAALGTGYGLSFTDPQIAAVNGFMIGVLTLITRNQTSPIVTAITKSSKDPTIEAAKHDGIATTRTA